MDALDGFDNLDIDDLDSLEENDTSAPPTKTSPRLIVILWLIAGGLLFTLIPVSLIAKTLDQESASVELDIQQVNDALLQPLTPPLDVQPLLSTLEAEQAEMNALDTAAAAAAASGGEQIYWPSIITAIRSYDPQRMVFTSLSQQDGQIIIEGTASDDTTVVDYAESLEISGLFSRVLIQSINVLDASASVADVPVTPQPGLSLTGTTTPQSDLLVPDAFEIDDFNPRDILLGQSQVHNFQPSFDVDRVKFLAKAGRHYRISTAALQPGVDTYLTVEVDDRTLINDDAKPGTLASEIIFQAGSSDAYAVVQISNRGQFGTDKTYEIVVEEVMATPTPIPSTTPTPTPTFTPAPSATRKVTPQSTSTPDVRDIYEPDDTTVRMLTPGETQQRNFYPDGDIDQLYFLAKAGRTYQIETSSLAAGVDTALSVNIDGALYSNDDRAWGDLSSLIVITGLPDRDVMVSATVINRGQYGPAKTYLVTLKEVAPSPTPTTSPTSTATPTPTVTATLPVTPASGMQLRRPPGLAMLLPTHHILSVVAPQTVAFVIVLELPNTMQ